MFSCPSVLHYSCWISRDEWKIRIRTISTGRQTTNIAFSLYVPQSKKSVPRAIIAFTYQLLALTITKALGSNKSIVILHSVSNSARNVPSNLLNLVFQQCPSSAAPPSRGLVSHIYIYICIWRECDISVKDSRDMHYNAITKVIEEYSSKIKAKGQVS